MKEVAPKDESNLWGRLAVIGAIGLIGMVAASRENYLVSLASIGLILGFNALTSLDSFHRR